MRDGNFNISKDGEYVAVSAADAAGSTQVLNLSEGYAKSYAMAGPALLSADKWVAIENGYKAALMAPTEILATQHYLSAKKLLGGVVSPRTGKPRPRHGPGS